MTKYMLYISTKNILLDVTVKNVDFKLTISRKIKYNNNTDYNIEGKTTDTY